MSGPERDFREHCPRESAGLKESDRVTDIAGWPELGRADGARPQELLFDVAAGDERAFVRLCEHVAAPVFGLVRRIVCDAAHSEEVAQEVLVEVWRSAAQYRSERGSAMAWIMTLAHRRAVDRVRSAQASVDREATAGRAGLGRSDDEVAETVLSRLEHQGLRRCLATLTDLQRESIVLTYYCGYTYRETASLLGSPHATVKTRVRDGLTRLRDRVGESEPTQTSRPPDGQSRPPARTSLDHP